MQLENLTKEQFIRDFKDTLHQEQLIKVAKATPTEIFTALAGLVRKYYTDTWIERNHALSDNQEKIAYYFSIEFLPGRMLETNLLNLGILDLVKEGFAELDIDFREVVEAEHDMALGNGGLGRLAAAFMDSLATTGYPGFGNGLRYRYGLFKQRIVDGYQVELPDGWFGSTGNVWETRKDHDIVYVKLFCDVFLESDEDGRFVPTYKNAQVLRAVPYDVPQIGYQNGVINNLRLWDVEIPEEYELDYPTLEARRRVKDITAILYPDDSTIEGKELRLVQEYFMTSAGLQTIIKSYLKMGLPLKDIHEKVSVHINDTHPAVAPAEFMRLLLDEYGLSWEDAWNATVKTMSYTNHTILQEALEKWDQQLFKRVLPRVYQIILEIDNRYVAEMAGRGVAADVIERTRIVKDNQVHMANLAIIGGHSVNGVAKLHTELLKEDTLHDFYTIYPEKFNNNTYCITQRRWLLHANPKLAELITETIGKGWITNLDELKKLVPYAEDATFRSRFTAIKKENKIALAQYIKETKGIDINPDSIFDIQVKRLHEYKRQLLNILHVIGLYNHLKMNPGLDMIPRTFIFGAKAAAGYHRAKLIIKLINAVADVVNNDPTIHGKIKVVFMENYRVSLAEKMIPAADVSEQISTAGKEASGTGNMKFMLNGALTIGTMDGANVEICEEVGRDNIFIFGMSAAEVQQKTQEGYDPWMVYNMNQEVRMALTSLIDGTFDPDTNLFRELYDALLNGCGGRADEYFVLEDYADYARAQRDIDRAYRDEEKWVRMAILNTAESGKFSSDRTIRQYADEIWQLPSVEIV